MTAVALYAGAAVSVLRRDLRMALSYRTAFISAVVGGVISITVFYYISRLVRVEQFASSDAYFAYVVAGLLILQILGSLVAGVPGMLRQELVAGTFERMVLAPFGPVGAIVSMLLFPFLFAVTAAALTLAFAVMAFGLDLAGPSALLVLPIAVLSGFAFAPFGLLLVGVVLVIKQAAVGVSWVLALISLIAGLYFPVELLPDGIRWMSEVQPFTPATDLVRHVLVGTPIRDPVWVNLVKIVGFAVVTFPIGLWAVAQGVRIGRRRGTIIEY